jgi:hypothetical protein
MAITVGGRALVQPPSATLRWMLFVDGENLTARAQTVATKRGVQFETGPNFERDAFIWFRSCNPRRSLYRPAAGAGLDDHAVRAYYYTSTTGGDVAEERVRRALWEMHFAPVVFKKPKGARSKGVDITLTKDMLSHAFHGHYDVAVLCTCDGDYVPVVQEVQRLGKIVHLAALTSGLSEKLKVACDDFFDLDPRFNQFPTVKPAAEGA